MQDPIADEIRRFRMEHTKQFGGDLRLICEDLRKLEATVADRLVVPEPKRRAREPRTP